MKIFTKQLSVAVISIAIMGTIPAAGGPLETQLDEPPSIKEGLVLTQTNTLLPIIPPTMPEKVIRTIPVMVTAYSSTVDQTDDTPFITASGTWVREGIVAANFVPIGTRIKLPELYGERVFIVEDRMHPRKKYQVDIWFPSYSEAINFGAKLSDIEILGS